MKKYKTKMVKFVFYRRQYRDDRWADSPPVDYKLGNKHTEELCRYQYHSIHISHMFSDELVGDPRRWDKKAKFSINEATILLLQHMEDRLRLATNEKKRLDRLEIKLKSYPSHPAIDLIQNTGYEYARKINQRELTHVKEAVKIYRKVVKEIKESKEYLWELMMK